VTENLPALPTLTLLTVPAVSESITCLFTMRPGEFGLQVRLPQSILFSVNCWFGVIEHDRGVTVLSELPAECSIRGQTRYPDCNSYHTPIFPPDAKEKPPQTSGRLCRFVADGVFTLAVVASSSGDLVERRKLREPCAWRLPQRRWIAGSQ